MIVRAQRVSSVDDAGSQTSSRRRLGDSLVISSEGGAAIVTLDTPGSPLVALYGSRRKYGSKRSSRNAEVFWTKYA